MDPSYRVPEADSDKNRANKKLFLNLATSYAIEPRLLTQYRRRAFVSSVDEYARISLDVSMKYRAQEHFDLRPDDSMVSYDNETIYARDMYGDARVVLELKSEIGRVPTWMLDLITTFDLKQQGFSKYLASSMVSNFDNGTAYMNADRILVGRALG